MLLTNFYSHNLVSLLIYLRITANNLLLELSAYWLYLRSQGIEDLSSIFGKSHAVNRVICSLWLIRRWRKFKKRSRCFAKTGIFQKYIYLAKCLSNHICCLGRYLKVFKDYWLSRYKPDTVVYWLIDDNIVVRDPVVIIDLI